MKAASKRKTAKNSVGLYQRDLCSEKRGGGRPERESGFIFKKKGEKRRKKGKRGKKNLKLQRKGSKMIEFAIVGKM